MKTFSFKLMGTRNTLVKFVLGLIIIGGLSSCTRYYYTTKHVPPGHAKKAAGAKSAKKYAPGQQKKH